MACKFFKQKKQVSYDDGVTWVDVTPAEYQKGSLYEYDSADCPSPTPTPQYRTLTTATTCINYDKYVLEEYQVSYDEGVTWTTTGTSATTLIEANSEDCGYVPPTPTFKWKATYTGGTTSSAQCDSTSSITNGEINKTGLTSVEIGTCVTTINDDSFSSCYSLTSITIPNSVTSIGERAFRYCTGLTSIDIPNSVTSIGNGAFRSCSGLTSITIPDSVTSISSDAFGYCSNLTSVTVLATTPPTLESSAFYGASNNLIIYVPSESVSAYKAASGWSSYSSKIRAIP